MRPLLLALVIVVTFSPGCRPPNAMAQQSATVTTIGLMKPGPWMEYHAKNGGRDVRIFVAHDDRPKPLVVFLRGRGARLFLSSTRTADPAIPAFFRTSWHPGLNDSISR